MKICPYCSNRKFCHHFIATESCSCCGLTRKFNRTCDTLVSGWSIGYLEAEGIMAMFFVSIFRGIPAAFVGALIGPILIHGFIPFISPYFRKKEIINLAQAFLSRFAIGFTIGDILVFLILGLI